MDADPRVVQVRALPAGRHPLNRGWRFGGEYAPGSEAPGGSEPGRSERGRSERGLPERGWAPVTLPHTATPLSWGDWEPAEWERQWIYRRHLAGAELAGGRAFVDFDGVMTSATVFLNGAELATHAGGYLPFSVELTERLTAGDNMLAVRVDATLQDVPPNSVARGAGAIDYLQPGGIHRDVTLRIVPEVHVADVLARPTDVLGDVGLEVQVTLDAAASDPAATLTATLRDGATVLGRAEAPVAVIAGQVAVPTLSLSGLRGVSLWSPESPALYEVRVTVTAAGATHERVVRTGFREAVFRPDGFCLNGARYQLVGLNRHELFPYLGMAAPARLQRRDAQLIRRELGANMIRCSHYPQSPHFLDACDELGLMVWEETPGWQHVGGAAFQSLVAENVRDMVRRDRSRPSVIAWGTRLNETPSAGNEALYARTREIARALDPTRPTTGAMIERSTRGFGEDLFGYDDYHSMNGVGREATLLEPIRGMPYLVSEAVGALSGAPRYRWVDPPPTLALQARMHARVHDLARADPAYAGVLGWCAIDYPSRNGGERIWRALKWAGVLDTFRVAKPAAAVYASQADPAARPIIAPAFSWDFRPGAPPGGPGRGALIATNCDELRLYVDGTPVATATPDVAGHPRLAHPPAFVDLPPVDGAAAPELRIDGLVGGRVVASVTMSADTSRDALAVALDDVAIDGDGSDATRFTVRAVDAHGNPRRAALVSGDVALTLRGPGTLVADNPFPLGAYGGVAGGFIRSCEGATGTVTLTAAHPTLGTRTATLRVVPADSPLAGEPCADASPPAVRPATPGLAGSPPRAPTSAPVAEAAVRAALEGLLDVTAQQARIGRLLRRGHSATFRAPAPGRLVVGWYKVTADGDHGVRRVLVACADAAVASAGEARIIVSPSARGRTLLRDAGHARLTAETTFAPDGRRVVRAARIIDLGR